MILPFRSSFHGGRNADTDPPVLASNQYISGTNVELNGDGTFSSLRNINGTDLIQQLSTSATFRVLNLISNKYLINDVLVDCLTIFSVDTAFKIHCYDLENSTLYELFSETVPDDYNSTVKEVDVKCFPENGTDINYFTDNYSELRYFKCEIPSPYTANFLTAYDLSLLRRGANGTITASVGSGGTLLSGTFQFSYRMCNAAEKRFTKWSSPSNPVHVYSKGNDSTPVYSGIGLITDRKITLTITPSEEELANFDQIQLAVIENVGATSPIAASLLEIEEIGGSSLTYEYKSNAKLGTVPLEDIVVDLAQIKTAKTLNVKDNRLFAANVKYTALEFDNGTPAITSGSVITQASALVDSFSSDEFASNYRGYWRGEVYRFGAVYRDEHGNASPVQPLDLSGVTNNTITGSLTDLKFPDRTNSNFTLFNSSGQLQSLGLRLTGLNNHPSWARSLEIVRVNRTGQFKNILFQSPIIPMSKVYGIGALDQYPNTLTYKGGEDNQRTLENATPMTSGFTLVPRNLFYPEFRDITKVTESSGSGTSRSVLGEVKQHYAGSIEGYAYSVIYPDQSMYEPTNPYHFNGSEKIDFVDIALVKLSVDEEEADKAYDVVQGDDLNTNISGTFYATGNNQYFYNNGHAKGALTTVNRAITEAEFFDNFGTTDSVAGKAVMDYDSLQTGGFNLGFKPNIQRCTVVKIGGNRIADVTESNLTFAAATWNGYSSGGALTSASATLKFEPASALTNKFITEYSGFSPDISYVNVVAIVNVKQGVGDDRYGESTDIQEYISTGCKYTFSSAEVATLEAGGDVTLSDLDVWGGDCVVSAHTFKVCDSTYAVTNQGKNIGSVDTGAITLSKWNNMLFKELTENQGILCMPVALEGAAQYVQVILESEYNGAVVEQDILTGSSASIPVMTGTVDTARTSLTYRYHSNLNKTNSQKIYVPEPRYSFKQNEFGARVHWTDLKIYNSDQAGFDIFRVADFYDVEERYRPITKLALAGNHLYSIHEQGVVYLPTGEGQIEQADGGTLAVRSGDVVGKPIIINNERGCQHLRSIVETGDVIFFPDNRNKTVYALSGQQLEPIIKDNETIFRSFLGTMKDDLLGIYDPYKDEYWIGDDTECHVFSRKHGMWVSKYTLNLRGAAATNQKLYVIGKTDNDNSIYSYYTALPGSICGATAESSVTLSVNPEPNWSKTFDNFMANASQRLSQVDYRVPRESQIGDQTGSASLDIASYEGTYRVKNPRDANGARLRGQHMLLTVTWNPTVQSALRAVETKYRLSSRIPW